MKYARVLSLILFGLGACNSNPSKPVTQSQSSNTVVTPKSEPIVFQNGSHPTVRYSYYVDHQHAFDCKHDPYSCQECPVGKPDRVIHLNHGNYRDVPVEVNLFFACDDINRLVPEAGIGVDDDEFLCQREPQDGSIEFGGKIYSCKEPADKGSQTIESGDLQPGESKSITIQVKPEP